MPAPDSAIVDAGDGGLPDLVTDASGDASRDAGADVSDASFSDVSDTGMDVSDVADLADAEACVPPDAGVEILTEVPQLLSQTGLYSDIATETLADGVRLFEPHYPLWSDGAAKRRWVYLPPCAKIDSADMDQWSYPVGTRLWKEFTRDGIRIETRLITRYGPGEDDWLFAAYLWNDDQTDADWVPDGVIDAKGTGHDVPTPSHCNGCHGHLIEPVLGFSALQLSHSGAGVTIDDLISEKRFTVDPRAGGYAPPGDLVQREALGYLHANCGNCHNDAPDAIEFRNPFVLKWSVADATFEDSRLYETAFDVFVERFANPACIKRIAPGDSDGSCVVVRMDQRGSVRQMPPIGTEIVHQDGVDKVRAWIDTLTP